MRRRARTSFSSRSTSGPSLPGGSCCFCAATLFSRPARKGPYRMAEGAAALGQARSPPAKAAQANPAGASIYAAACAACHETGRPLPYGGVNLGLSTAISGPDPRNLANIVLSGVRAVEGERSPIMPGFAASMNETQIAALLNYLRARFGNQPAWTGVEKTIADARRTETVLLQTSAGPRSAPADPTQRDKP